MSNYIKLLNNLDTLKLSTIKEYLPSFLDNNLSNDLSFVDILLELTNKEVDFRESRAAEINLSISNFPYRKTIKDFDFSYQPSVSKPLILDLLSLRFLESFDNILFIGSSEQVPQLPFQPLMSKKGLKRRQLAPSNGLLPLQLG